MTAAVPAYFKGKKNIYTCEICGEHIVSIDADAGVTPFLIGCAETTGGSCVGKMKSSLYRVDQNLRASHEWYRPAQPPILGFSQWVREHIEKGGLIIRRIAS
jgi:hypothetical protein